MNYTMNKEKNLYLFYQEGKTVPYTLDVNTGIFYGLKHKAITKYPAGFKTWATEQNNLVLQFLLNDKIDKKYLLLADKMINIGYQGQFLYGYSNKLLQCVNDHFKEFVAYINEIPNRKTAFNLLDEFYNFIQVLEIKKKYPDIPEEIAQYITDCNTGSIKENLELSIYYLYYGGLYDFSYFNDGFYPVSCLRRYYEYCGKINETPKKTNNFIKEFNRVKGIYELNKKELDIKQLQENYQKYYKALNFETEEYTVVLPQSADDFKHEAKIQNNCVYRCYYESAVNGKTYIIFIRKKNNPDYPYITCEVSKNGNIRQYLLARNNSPTEQQDKEFKKLYQEHLTINWNREN